MTEGRMTATDYQRWWMAYEPRSPDATTCPRCEHGDDYNHGTQPIP